ncbi:hypothetical protein [uncultured Psychroserpens sp.]|uniref:hypothetical protein n=1 Tax=uncultured Psychroserpens sp. TaxID=255436 RepID=UPI0026285622|nr:hypothetical protein [uncultured Psychroserpens sp.]
MKTLISLFLLISFTASAQKLDRKQMYSYSDDVEFRIYAIQKSRTADRNQEVFVAEKGQRFFTIVFEFKNKSSEAQVIDFEKIFIKDKDGNLHEVDLVVMSMKLTTSIKKFQQKLKANKKRKIIAQFIPPLPKKELIKTLVIDGTEIELKYN